MLESNLPVYPYEVRGTVRHILILKDFFMLCSKLLERYCYLGGLAGRQINSDYIFTEIKSTQKQIEILQKDYKKMKNLNKKLITKIYELRKELIKRGATVEKYRPLMLESACFKIKNKTHESTLDNDVCINIYYNDIDLKPQLPEPFRCQKVKTVLEFIKELFLIQMHFQIVLCQGLNFALPILTADLDLIDRIMFWPERPEFGLLNKKVLMADKLRDIQVEMQRVIEELVSVCLITEAKYLYDLKLEEFYFQSIDIKCKEKSRLMANINFQREMYELYLLEHSRLVGHITKLTPDFAKNPKVTDIPLDRTRNNLNKLKNNTVINKTSEKSEINKFTLPKIHNNNNKVISFNSNTDSIKQSSKSDDTDESNNNIHMTKRINDLINLSKNFTLKIENNFINNKEIKSKKEVLKMRESVLTTIDNDRKYLMSVRHMNC